MTQSLDCPICRSKQRPFPVPGIRPLRICEECRHITWVEHPTENELAAYYGQAYGDSHQQPELQERQAEYYRGHLDFLAGRFSEDRILDLVDYGCAWPTLLSVARPHSRFGVLCGVEYDAKARAFGQSHGVTMISPLDFGEAIADESVDIIRFSHVLE